LVDKVDPGVRVNVEQVVQVSPRLDAIHLSRGEEGAVLEEPRVDLRVGLQPERVRKVRPEQLVVRYEDFGFL
jgi:hypothetical protein